MTEPALLVDSLWIRFGSAVILQGAFLRVDRGTVCALVGRNGSGKSTLLKAIAGIHRHTQGFVSIQGERFIFPNRSKRFHHMSYLPQTPLLPIGLRLSHIEEQLPQHVVRTILSSNSNFKRHGRLSELSFGVRRYVEVHFTIGLGRPVVLLDEPFHSIDPILIESLCDVIRSRAATGTTFVVTDHNLQYVEQIATAVWLVESRTIREIKEPPESLREVMRRPPL
ncbi:MAG TPA: ATP-binding cassette domain-containing protein [Candidatus Kapabacteria bacterium]|nr:ATP-binding cassette domain-containing protein [Candidatus Kapabacteria bacterium]